MTIEKLLECDAETLKSFTDQQLLEFFTPYLKVTRPEMAAVTKAVNSAPKFKKMPVDERKAAKHEAAQKILDQLGLGIKL